MSRESLARHYKTFLIDHNSLPQGILEKVIESFSKYNTNHNSSYIKSSSTDPQESLIEQYKVFRKSYESNVDQDNIFITIEVPMHENLVALNHALNILNKENAIYSKQEFKEYSIKPLRIIAEEQYKALKMPKI